MVRFYFSEREVKDLLVASGVLLIAFYILWRNTYSIIDVSVAVFTGFLTHELAHKFLAQHLRYHAEFIASKFGLVIAIVSSFLGFVFAAPGAVQVGAKFDLYGRGQIHLREYGLISLVGPLSNIVLAIVLFSLLPYSRIFALGIWVNLFLAGFNMIPFMPFDGAKVWNWNKLVWLATVITIAALWFTII
jgi:Zn-dependent protease